MVTLSTDELIDVSIINIIKNAGEAETNIAYIILKFTELIRIMPNIINEDLKGHLFRTYTFSWMYRLVQIRLTHLNTIGKVYEMNDVFFVSDLT